MLTHPEEWNSGDGDIVTRALYAVYPDGRLQEIRLRPIACRAYGRAASSTNGKQ